MKRESGYYWVKYEGSEWVIGQYYQPSNIWRIDAYPYYKYNDELTEIDERRIVRNSIKDETFTNEE
jgi:hypothetical protein